MNDQCDRCCGHEPYFRDVRGECQYNANPDGLPCGHRCMSIADAAPGQKGDFTFVKMGGTWDDVVIHYRLPEGYKIFRVANDEGLAVRINNFLADVYDEGKRKFEERADYDDLAFLGAAAKPGVDVTVLPHPDGTLTEAGLDELFNNVIERLRDENPIDQRLARHWISVLSRELVAARRVATTARDSVWDPENWEAYVDSKGSNSVAWPPEFLLMAQAVEEHYGPMPVDDDSAG